MTTAHRPTFFSVQGGDDQGGNRLVIPTTKISARDLPSNKILKTRRIGQGNDEESEGRDFKEELLTREKQSKSAKALSSTAYVPPPSDLVPPKIVEDDRPFSEDEDHDPTGNRSDNNDSESDEDSSDDEDEAMLLKELERIKRERKEETEKLHSLDEERKKEQDKIELLRGNPLLMTDVAIRKGWDEDSVFKNQVKDLQKPKKRFINDTARSDFHKRFMAKYIK